MNDDKVVGRRHSTHSIDWMLRSLISRIQVSLMLAFMLLLIAASGCKENTETPAPEETAKAETTNATPPDKRLLTRLFWQDRTEGVLYSGDLSRNAETYEIQKSSIKEFPKLATDKVDMVQMALADGRLFVGVRDHAKGTVMSGWIEVDPGVQEDDHGDHSHWHYDSTAKVLSSVLDTEQGNPAHVYRYGDHVYIANDQKNGFTQVQPAKSTNQKTQARFFQGGGGHITLAAVNDRIAYSTWIDRAGDNAGRVDVVDLRGQDSGPRYSFNLPVGGIHGAGPCGNRVFFAPAHGVCWVDCDFDFALNKDTVDIQQLSLDEEPDGTEYRTGAFESFRNHLLCIANSKSGTPALCIINGTAPTPSVVRIACEEIGQGLRLSTVSATLVTGNRCFAFAFAEGDAGDEKLYIFELDPNGDRDFRDAVLSKVIDVGQSQLEGHFGHHGITFLGDRKTAVISNPGDGTLEVLDLIQMEIVESIEVGGQPTHLVSYGETP